ncbi:MAG: alpha/beta hydrolase [Verrucomicrobia bacterium]|nr:MAG: alpha/beta hydrolase [Verrucomicrobiota bacterium]
MKSSLALPVILLLSTCSAWSQSPEATAPVQSPDPSTASAASDTSTPEATEFLNPPAGVETRGDVSYLPEGRKEKMDLYIPKNRPAGTLSPAVLLIHGGGWTGGDKRQAREMEIGTTLAENGFVAASINYALKSAGKYPINLQDCKNGIRYLRAHAKELGINPNKIAVLGGSAGGHLALMVGYTSGDASLAPTSPYPDFADNVSAVIDMYGVTDIGNRKKTDKDGNPLELRGVDSQVKKIFGETDSDWKKASPITYVRKDVPPTLILQGKRDTTVDRDQSQSLYDALIKAGAVTEVIYLDKAGHTFSFKYAAAKAKKPLERDIGPEVIAFLKKHLGNS